MLLMQRLLEPSAMPRNGGRSRPIVSAGQIGDLGADASGRVDVSDARTNLALKVGESSRESKSARHSRQWATFGGIFRESTHRDFARNEKA
jgi:lauroyl/myristoyl acyltransferase